jgi:hypothetical protein
MKTLISAIQKLVIKDVVQYADNKIEATKSVVYDEVVYDDVEAMTFSMAAETPTSFGDDNC